METNEPGGVQSVARAFRVLEALGSQGGEASLGELAAATDLTAPTIHRLVRTLVDLGAVRQLPDRRYALGPAVIPLGEHAARLLGAWARPALERLESATHETANLAILDGDAVVYVAQVPSRHRMRMFTEVGRRVLPHATGVGKALLADLPHDRVLALVGRTGMPRYTDATIGTAPALLAELAAVRQRGYAIDEGEQEVGVRCLAVAVPGAATPTAVSVSGPAARVTDEAAAAMVPALLEAAAGLAGALSAR